MPIPKEQVIVSIGLLQHGTKRYDYISRLFHYNDFIFIHPNVSTCQDPCFARFDVINSFSFEQQKYRHMQCTFSFTMLCIINSAFTAFFLRCQVQIRLQVQKYFQIQCYQGQAGLSEQLPFVLCEQQNVCVLRTANIHSIIIVLLLINSTCHQ